MLMSETIPGKCYSCVTIVQRNPEIYHWKPYVEQIVTPLPQFFISLGELNCRLNGLL